MTDPLYLRDVTEQNHTLLLGHIILDGRPGFDGRPAPPYSGHTVIATGHIASCKKSDCGGS
jgi:hypothetical protein